MTKTEGEYELVLGNQQLLSAFFIIVILLKQYLSVIKRPKMHDKSLSESTMIEHLRVGSDRRRPD